MAFETAATVRDKVVAQLTQNTEVEAVDLGEKYKSISELISAAASANLFEVGQCVLPYSDNGEELAAFLETLGYKVTYDSRRINILISWSAT